MNKLYPRSVKCKRPKFRDNVGGRTWDLCVVIDGNGSKCDGWLDTTWGQYFYFVQYVTPTQYEWRKAKLSLFDAKENVFDFRLLCGNNPERNLVSALDILLKE